MLFYVYKLLIIFEVKFPNNQTTRTDLDFTNNQNNILLNFLSNFHTYIHSSFTDPKFGTSMTQNILITTEVCQCTSSQQFLNSFSTIFKWIPYLILLQGRSIFNRKLQVLLHLMFY